MLVDLVWVVIVGIGSLAEVMEVTWVGFEVFICWILDWRRREVNWRPVLYLRPLVPRAMRGRGKQPRPRRHESEILQEGNFKWCPYINYLVDL